MASPSSGWAGGAIQPSNGGYTSFILRWNGSVWKPATIKLRDPFSQIYAMAAGPHGATWAVGRESPDGRSDETVVAMSMRWTGRAWQEVPVTIPDSGSLMGVTFIPGGTAWAVGEVWQPPAAKAPTTVILHWNGKAWS
jgi:hypothetical protein